MKIWITKYALTKGILEVDSESVRDFSFGSNDSGSVYYREQNGYPQGFHKGEWYSDKKLAIAKAEEMKKKKLCSLWNQRKKIEKMKFE